MNTDSFEAYETAIDQLSPMVFCCAKCQTIITDSTEFLCSDKPMGCIIMAGATNISIDYRTSPDGCYQELTCARCKAELGRRYLDKAANPLKEREGFCLNVSALDSYQLGTAEARACDRWPPKAGGASSSKAAAPESSSLQQRIADLENDLVKVQNMVLLHQERLEALEGAG